MSAMGVYLEGMGSLCSIPGSPSVGNLKQIHSRGARLTRSFETFAWVSAHTRSQSALEAIAMPSLHPEETLPTLKNAQCRLVIRVVPQTTNISAFLKPRHVEALLDEVLGCNDAHGSYSDPRVSLRLLIAPDEADAPRPITATVGALSIIISN